MGFSFPISPRFSLIRPTALISTWPLCTSYPFKLSMRRNWRCIQRSGAAFGVHVLIVGETCCSPFQRRAVSGSMGTVFEQPVVEVDNLVETLTALRTRGLRCLERSETKTGKVRSRNFFMRNLFAIC